MSLEIYGTEFNDVLFGSLGNDVVWGFSGDDQLFGFDGDDQLYGGLGNDFLVGGTGNDYVAGGDGIDYIIGSDPNVFNSGSGEFDVLTGGGGLDFFGLGDQFEAYYQDSLGFGVALITDFNFLEGDQLVVHGSSSDYSFFHDNWFGTDSTDTAIFYQGDMVGILQDAYTSEAFINQDFIFV